MKNFAKYIFSVISVAAVLVACNPNSKETTKKVTKVGNTNVGKTAKTAVSAQAKELGLSDFGFGSKSLQGNGFACVTTKLFFADAAGVNTYGSDTTSNTIENCYSEQYGSWSSNFIYASNFGGATWVAKCSDNQCSFNSMVLLMFKGSNGNWTPNGYIAFMVDTSNGQVVLTESGSNQPDPAEVIYNFEATQFNGMLEYDP